MAGNRDRRVRGSLVVLLLAVLVALVVSACHPQEPPGKRDGAAPRQLA